MIRQNISLQSKSRAQPLLPLLHLALPPMLRLLSTTLKMKAEFYMISYLFSIAVHTLLS